MTLSNAGMQGLRPGVVTSTTRPTTPYTGQIIYEVDTGFLRVWDGANWDYLSPKQDTIPGAYTSYTPTWTGLTVGNGTSSFAYSQINKMVHVFGRFVFGSTSAVTGVMLMTLPVDRINADLAVLGTATMQDSGTGTYMGYPLSNTVGGVYIFRADHTVGATVVEGNTSATVPFTWTTNDAIQVNLWYRSA